VNWDEVDRYLHARDMGESALRHSTFSSNQVAIGQWGWEKAPDMEQGDGHSGGNQKLHLLSEGPSEFAEKHYQGS